MGIRISDMSELTASFQNADSVLPIVDPLENSTTNQDKKIRFSTFSQFINGNRTVPSQTSYTNYFGTGVEGDVTFSSSVQMSSSFTNEFNGDFFVKNFKNLSIPAGLTVSPLYPCRGLIIFCTGDCTIDGTLTMTAKGGGVRSRLFPSSSLSEGNFDTLDISLYFNSSSLNGFGNSNANWARSGSMWFDRTKKEIPIKGTTNSLGTVNTGTGAFGGRSGGNGNAGVFCCGSGGGGGIYSLDTNARLTGSAGGTGTIFAGGGGGGGMGTNAGGGGSATAASAIYEQGSQFTATGTPVSNGGGAGNPAGGGNSSNDGGFGVGGLLILIVKGNLTINSSGVISNNGVSGGSGTTGGGGSGGGRTILLYGGTYTNLGSIVANGGSGGGGSGAGGSGGAGSITIRKIDP
jgi:hypothetical protein